MPAETTSEAAPTTAHHPWARTPCSRRRPSSPWASLAVAYLRTLGGPSLWLDEAWEANYYVGVEPSPWYNRPVLYMASVRALVVLFGPHETVLRLLPCLAGLGAVALTFALVRREVGEPAAWIAAAVLAVAPPFLFHAHVLKSYTLDALFAAALRSPGAAGATGARGGTSPPSPRSALSFGFSFRGRSSSRRGGGRSVEHRRALRALVPFVVVCAALAALFAAVFLVWHAGATGDDLLQAYFVERYPRLAGGLGALGSPLWWGWCGTRRGSSRAWPPSPWPEPASGWPGAGAQGP